MDFRIEDNEEGREVELPALKLIHSLGYDYLPNYELNKETLRPYHNQVLLYPRLRDAIERINGFDSEGVEAALREIHEDKFLPSLNPLDANEKIRIKLTGRSSDTSIDQPVTIKQYGEKGIEYPTAFFIDFDNPEKNDFLVTNQFKHIGARSDIEADIVCFINGIPLVLIECKKPSTIDLMKTAWEENLEKYQNPRFGHQKLFFYNHVIMTISDIQAKYGTIESGPNTYSKWTSLSNMTLDELEKLTGRVPSPQDIMLAGMLKKETLLDLLKNFVIYEIDQGKKTKKVAKHQQYRVVTQAVERIRSGKRVEDKGGVVWHTQGSGKSLSMVWFATQLLYKFENPTIMIITDRRHLNKQIFDTFKNCGFPDPAKPRNRKQLSDLLQTPKGRTIMVNLQKFDKPEDFPRTKEKIYVLVDEAHRSQYKWTAGYMRDAMPNAVFFAFTGTPIDKKNRSTYKRFGPLIDKYSFEESKSDGTTLKVKYTGRLPELAIEGGDSLDEIFERLFGHLPKEEQAELKRKYATKSKIAEAPARIREICKDIVNHYNGHIAPNGYKAMIVASSRDAAVIYERELDKIGAPLSRIIMDSKPDEVGKDGTSWAKYYLPSEERLQKADEFTSPTDPHKILIVVDMLLVGYDVPIVQVMYLDKPLKEHSLLQAIARVNRLYDDTKDHGLIVDYIGITKDLQKALKIFDEQDVEGVFDSIKDDLLELDARHKEFMQMIAGLDEEQNSEIVKRFEDEDEQEKLEYAFKKFAKSLEAVLPDKEAVGYEKDFKFGCKIRAMIRAYYHGDKPNMREYGKKVQQLIDDHIRALGIKELMEPTEITYGNFLAFIEKFKDDRAKTALLKTKTMQVIRELGIENPAFFEKLREKLEKLIVDEKERRVDAAAYFTGLREFYQEALTGPQKIQDETGIQDKFALAVYFILLEESDDKDLCKKYANEILTKIQKITAIKDWREKTGLENDLYFAVYDTLDPDVFSKKSRDKIANKIIKLVRDKRDW